MEPGDFARMSRGFDEELRDGCGWLDALIFFAGIPRREQARALENGQASFDAPPPDRGRFRRQPLAL